jgi:hypothetical protein
MKATLNLWLSQNLRVHGVLAGGIRYPDGAAFSQTFSSAYPQGACDNALRLLGDLQNGVLHAVRRPDGACLGVFTLHDPNDYDETELNRLLETFLTLNVPVM